MSRKVVRVTEDEFELDDGRIFPHVERLKEVPTIEEFQKIYDEWVKTFQEKGLIEDE